MKKSLLFFIVFIVLILLEIIKGLSANGTPPLLQEYDWQFDLAYFMFNYILYFRILLGAILIFLLWKIFSNKRPSKLFIATSLIIFLVWFGIYWFFNHYYNGGSKYPPLNNPIFKTAATSEIPTSTQILGVDINGVQKAYPLEIMVYHHQFPDIIGDQSLWVTYCGMCRSGRVFEKNIDGQELDFSMIGAINYNAVFKDNQSGSWWHQETGEAIKGKYKGEFLPDYPMDQMSLENWLTLHPDSEILQYETQYQKTYNRIEKIFIKGKKPPGWTGQKQPPLIIGITIDGQPKAYDWESLKKQRIVNDQIGDKNLVLCSSEDGTSAFAYDRKVGEDVLLFEMNGNTLIDTKTQSIWNIFGKCIEGELTGTQLESIQSYQQYIRAWKQFHTGSTYYEF